MATAVPPVSSPPPAAPKGRPRSMRRASERLFLGSVMAVIAVVVDRRLRRVFIRKI